VIVVEVGDFAGGEGVVREIEGELEDFSFGSSADEPAVAGGGFERPENVGDGGAVQVGEDRAGDETSIGARGEAFEAAAGNVAEKVDREAAGERGGGE
jgi:hypothetical protein